MPRYLKIIIGILVFEIILSILSLPSTKAILWILIDLGILSGFRNRSLIAWNFARAVRLLALIAYVLVAIIYIPFLLSIPQLMYSVPIILGVLGFGLLIQLIVFIALENISVKEYFGVSHKNK